MDFNFGSLGATFFGWGTSLLFWSLLILALAIVFIIALYIRNKMRFTFPCLETVSLGQGKISVYISKAGWFKKNRYFFGLLERGGEQELICEDNKRKIFNVSSEDYHEINGKRGVIVKRKDDDPEILVPISKVEVANMGLLFKIAPADYRDAAVDILEKKRLETMDWLQRNSPMLIAVGVFIFGLISLIIIFNFAQGESSAWRDFAEHAINIKQAVPSPDAP